MVELKRGESPFAMIHSIHPKKDGIEFHGSHYSAFRLRTPDWLDRPIIWMFALRGGKGMHNRGFFDLSILPMEGEAEFKLDRTWFDKARFPKFTERFPGFDGFFTQKIDKPLPAKGKEYIVWFAFGHREIEEIRFALTAWWIPRMPEIGMLPTNYPSSGPGPAFATGTTGKPKPPKDSVKEAAAMRKSSGVKAALDFLDKELAAHTAAGGSFRDFYVALWKEAQTGGGRSDAGWAASVNEWLQQKSLSWDAYEAAEEICSNTVGSMISANRYGGARQALAPFFFAMERRLVSTDPLMLKDLGPAFDDLPEIRNREFPLMAKRQVSAVDPCGWVRVTKEMPRQFASSMNSLANLEFVGGDWKRAIERCLWAAAWSEANSAKHYEFVASWFEAKSSIANQLRNLGMLESADRIYQEILTSEWTDPYRERSKTLASLGRISIRIVRGEATQTMLGEIEALQAKIRGNVYLTHSSWEHSEVVRARCLAALGRTDEADAALTKLVAGKDVEARMERIRIRLNVGKLDSLESEMVEMLGELREWGRKIDEAALYSLYADLLEKSGRLAESIAMRREAIRLDRSFDLFTDLPLDLSKLALTLARLGDLESAKAAEKEARELVSAKGRIPARIGQSVAGILQGLAKPPATSKPKSGKRVPLDLQPAKALVIPVDGMPVRGRMTLTNTNDVIQGGTLSVRGMPANVSWDGVVARVRLGEKGSSSIKLTVNPGSYAMIDLDSMVPSPTGDVTVVWSEGGGSDPTSVWTIGAAEKGEPWAVIDAGNYQGNPFYSIPIHHHYQVASGKESSAAIRVRSSTPSRIEVYDGKGRPVSVDVNGNGDLSEEGDSLFADADQDGLPDLGLENGECSLRFQVFPVGGIPVDGIRVELEAFAQGAWVHVAEDRITR